MTTLETIDAQQTGSDRSSRPARGLNLAAHVMAPSWGLGIAGLVADFTPGEATLILEDLVAEGTPVTVQFNAFNFDGEILFCRPRGSRYEVHVSINDVDGMGRRRTPRFPVSIPARVFACGLEAALQTKIVDLSEEGLGLEVPSELAIDEIIAVESETNTAFGVVRHCRETSPGLFRVGIQLHHVMRREPVPEKSRKESGLMSKVGACLALGRKNAKPSSN